MSRSDRILIATGGGALILAVAAALVLLVPVVPDAPDDAGFSIPTTAASGEAAAADVTDPPTTIVVDVAGAVAQPGLIQLPAGTRIGDALAAAGGFATDADLDAATTALNLAQPLTDGEQIRVPRIGEVAAAGTGAPGSAAAGGSTGGDTAGLVNLNTATPEQLEALPGIGPVTAQKIVAARQERPFSSLDDAQQRGVIHRGQLESIRELATAG